MGQDLQLENYVGASTPKLGEWAERWVSRESRTIKYFMNLERCRIYYGSKRESQRSAHSPSLGVDAPT